MTDMLDIIRKRRSIRKYTDEQIPRESLEKIIDAGLRAPTAGGRQGTMIAALCGKTLSDRVGRLNLARFDRSRLSGSFVSPEQPSVIDDPTIKSGFYGAPCVCAVFAERDFLYSIPDAFCAAENMAIAATALGISSCIVARGEETFDSDEGKRLLAEWKIPAGMVCRCFVLLGYADGEPPKAKARKPGRAVIVEG